MRPPSHEFLQRAAFVLSVALLAFGYGWVTRARGWFPSDAIVRAWQQADRVVGRATAPPDFTSQRVYRGGGISATEPEAMQPGLTLIVSTFEELGWKPGAILMDAEGRVHHHWRVSPAEIFSRSDFRRGTELAEQDLHGVYLLPDGDLLANVEYAGTVRLDACSRVEWKLSAGSHHSIERGDDGTFWIPGITGPRRARTPSFPDGVPGLKDGIHHPLILQLDAEERDLVQAINVLDVLYANDLARYIPKHRQHDQRDVVHTNDVEPLPADLVEEYPLFEAGDLLVSLRNLDLVMVLDPDTHRVKWHASEPFIMQHDPDWIGDGWIGVFDNNKDYTARGSVLGGSRIVAVRPGSDSVRVLFPTRRSEPFYTEHRGSWQLLENGNLLLTESGAGRVVEVAPDGRSLWEWVAPPYDADHVPSVGRAQRIDLTSEEVASWPCSGGSRPD